MKLWDKGFSTDKQIDIFTVGDDRLYDCILVRYDIIASQAHAKMLAKTGLISTEEGKALDMELSKILTDVEQNGFDIETDFEDMHSKIEYLLTKSLGDTGKKIHTARSRNDQVLVAIHLYLKDELKIIRDKTNALFQVLMTLANRYKAFSLPGYTHLQIAMPSSFGLWFSAYGESLIDDVYFLKAAYKVADQNPLGSAAGYGSSFPIDRKFTSELLGFKTLKYNVIAAQMSRGKVEKSTSIAMSSIAATIGRLAMDICLYMSQNFNFISFPEQLTTGSSIMPHKKNPDVFELIRAKCNVIQSVPNQFALLMANLPSGYHRDFQLCKKIIMPEIENLKSCLDILSFSLEKIQVNEYITDDSKYDYLYSVDTLNEMIIKDKLPFRDAYKNIGDKISKNQYKPLKNVRHQHIGSKDNLALKDIKNKMKKALKF